MGKLIIILIFVGIGIIRKLAEDAAKQRQKRAADEVAKMPKDQRAKVQSEIEAFLQGVTGQKPAQQGKKPRRQARSQRRQRQAEAKERQQQQARAEAEQLAQGSRSPPISSVGQHVQQYIGKHVDQHIGHGMEEDEVPVEVVRDGASEERKSETQGSQPVSGFNAEDIAAMLRTPQGMRQAIIASEVLSRPRVLRR